MEEIVLEMMLANEFKQVCTLEKVKGNQDERQASSFGIPGASHSTLPRTDVTWYVHNDEYKLMPTK